MVVLKQVQPKVTRPYSLKDRARFWGRVNPGGEFRCWAWTRGRDYDGYGIVHIGNRSRRAHRVAWEMTYGPIPAGLCVLHACDNPPCCNPAHLSLGTSADNNRDRARKGRSRPTTGETSHRAKLTDRQAAEIRERWRDEPAAALAAEYGVHHMTIRRIAAGRTYRSA